MCLVQIQIKGLLFIRFVLEYDQLCLETIPCGSETRTCSYMYAVSMFVFLDVLHFSSLIDSLFDVFVNIEFNESHFCYYFLLHF
jgi:hypothetical protein